MACQDPEGCCGSKNAGSTSGKLIVGERQETISMLREGERERGGGAGRDRQRQTERGSCGSQGRTGTPNKTLTPWLSGGEMSQAGAV